MKTLNVTLRKEILIALASVSIVSTVAKQTFNNIFLHRYSPESFNLVLSKNAGKVGAKLSNISYANIISEELGVGNLHSGLIISVKPSFITDKILSKSLIGTLASTLNNCRMMLC
jgi:hypothetical protein